MCALFVGIDPGVGGGIAVIDADGMPQAVERMPETDHDVLAVLRPWVEPLQPGTIAALERVHSSPQMGVRSAFTFGRSYGGVRMALAALRVPYEEVAPAVWQRALRCQAGHGGDKSVAKARAQALFPGVRVTNAVADALLLAEYARRLALHVPSADPPLPAAAAGDRARWGGR